MDNFFSQKPSATYCIFSLKILAYFVQPCVLEELGNKQTDRHTACREDSKYQDYCLISTDGAFKLLLRVYVLHLEMAVELFLGHKVAIADFTCALGHV